MPEIVLYLFVIGMAVVWGVGGILFGLAFRQLGSFELTAPFLAKWALNPLVIAAVLTGIFARVLFYIGIGFFSVSQLTLFGALGIVATLALGRLVLGDVLSVREWVGASLVIVGTALIGR
jgi:drug/metabolite transporter (DMT)-like permease